MGSLRGFWGRLDASLAGRLFLWILSRLYAVVQILWTRLGVLAGARPKSVAAPVISVGNLTMGGTGKTSVVSYLATRLLERGFHVAVLSRGYKGGDEARMLKEKFEVFGSRFRVLVGKNRHQSAAFFLSGARRSAPGGVFILDDGHQHRTLVKDFSIVLIDASDPVGLRGMTPYGFLREPLACGLKRADLVILTHADFSDAATVDSLEALTRRTCAGISIFRGVHRPLGFRLLAPRAGPFQEPGFFNGRKAALVSGIGNPASFERTMARLGARILAHEVKDDHAVFTASEIGRILGRAKQAGAEAVATTAKDAVRLAGFLSVIDKDNGNVFLPWYALEVEFAFLEGEDRFWNEIEPLWKKFDAATA
ncbi:MAG: tetraacyldisaccharide 4'-kinase [Elusimicrobiota bacterium]